jgi:hypothetical protein
MVVRLAWKTRRRRRRMPTKTHLLWITLLFYWYFDA